MAALRTIEEAADELRNGKTRNGARWLRDWLHDHPPPAGEPPYYLQAGRARLFTDNDLARIKDHMRELSECRLNSERRAKAKRRTGRSEEATSESKWKLAQELIGRPLQLASNDGSRNGSSAANIPTSQKLRLVPHS